MRLERLVLERYGRFEDAAFDFSGKGVRVHVVYGPNEAGKSTLLAAIGDLLFGIPHRTAYNFRHESARLRIAAAIEGASGEVFEFKRRKGNAGTLLTAGPQELALPDGALGRFLGGAGRELFERMFGLDHERLRAGGRAMLEADGDLARSLFEAGSGLASVSDVLRSVAADLDRIGDLDARKASTKPLWREVEAFAVANQAFRRDAMRVEEWQSAEQALEDARGDRERIDAALRETRRRRARLERVRRAAPVLAAVDDLRREAAELADAPDLPASFAEAWRQCLEAVRDEEASLSREQAAVRQAAREREAVPTPGSVLSLSEEIAFISESLGKYRKDRLDCPKLERDIAADDELIASQLRSLGLPADAEAEWHVPSVLVVTRIRELVREGESVRARVQAAREALRNAQSGLRRADAVLEASAGARDPGEAAALIRDAARLGDVPGRIADTERALEAEERHLSEAVRRLRSWDLPPSELALRPFPDAQTVAAFEEEFRRARENHQLAQRSARDAGAELHRVQAELAGLAAQGEVPSPAAVRAARDRRDLLWRLIRARHVHGASVPESIVEAHAPGGDLGGSYEEAVRHADELVDRRETEAQRVARLAELTSQRERSAGRQREAAEIESSAGSALAAIEARWRTLWLPAGVTPDAPTAMRGWLAQKDEVLRALAAERSAREALASVRALAREARTLLGQAADRLGLKPGDEVTLAELDREVRTAFDLAQRAWTERQGAIAAALAERERVAQAQGDLAAAGEAEERWRQDWRATMAELSLAADTLPAEAQAALDAWDAVRQHLASRRKTQRRLEGLRRDVAGFEEAILAVLGRLGPEAAGLDGRDDPEGAARALAQRLRDAQALRLRAAELGKHLEAARSAEAIAAERLRDAVAARDRLRTAHGLAEDADALLAAERAERRRAIESQLREQMQRLFEAGAGLDEASLREEARAFGPDEIAAELEGLQASEERLIADSQTAAQRETEARLALDALAGRKGVAGIAQEARNAALAVRSHAERWLRLRAARCVLERALERYRAENEHPLVRRAGELFSRIASSGDNPIVRLAVDYGDGRDPRLVGIREDGTLCPVDRMSEGTRDQLYLALRIAAVEHYCAEHEPLPFVADDLFVTSDDERTLPGLAALAELGRSAQVILFTHHLHVLGAARTLPGDWVRFHRLPATAEAAVPEPVLG